MRNSIRSRKKGGFGKTFILVIIVAILASIVYLYNSVMFEQNKPEILVSDTVFWNLKSPIPIQVKDDSGVKFVRITLSDGNNTVVLANEIFATPQKLISLEASYPKTAFFDKKSKLNMQIQTTDSSLWNFFMGNENVKNISLKIDTKKPNLYILTNSYSIVKGGSASVVFNAEDENLQELYIKTSSGEIYKPTPFYKKNFYISLVSWKYNAKDFQAHIVAVDKAGNISKERIKFYLLNKKYKTSTIGVTDKFINGKINDLANIYTPEDAEKMNKLEKFKFINETLRQDNEKKIKKVTSHVPNNLISNFHLFPFYPLKNAAAVASFGDHRYYKYGQTQVSESYHLGIDLASTAQANIVTSNDGVVVFAEDNGIYGNNLIISHGAGVYSLYGHCSSFNVSVGDKVKRGDVVAKTGVSGLALGDHLHFGILVQGIEVRPEEWMDPKWFIDNITNVVKDAQKIIDRK